MPETTAEACASCHDAARLVPHPEFAHDPVREGTCEACHESHVSKHASLLREPGKESCFGCHDGLRAFEGKTTVHAPFQEGRCVRCHDPHGGSAPAHLVLEVPKLCADCHDLEAPRAVASHQGFPLGDADCGGCHNPHASDGATLSQSVLHPPYEDRECAACHDPATGAVDGPETTLCFGCHAGLGEELEKGALHEPLTGPASCTVCHEPHAAPAAMLLPMERDRLCGRCHEEVAGQVEEAAFSHPPQSTGTCSICHDPHQVRGEDGLNVAERRCASCHAFEDHIMHPMGGGLLDPRTQEPLGCVSCHSPHGSDHVDLLQDDPNGRLCVGCHTDKIRAR
jgi:predicted CXXCH cytochrome family protein